MRNTWLFIREHRYQLALLSLLILSSVISVALFSVRTPPRPHGPYTSLGWHLVLAWIPLIFAWIAFVSINLPKIPRLVIVGLCAGFWLLFFPNALYILTDFQHLAIRDTATPVWYDVIMLLWFSWSGLFLGVISLYLMQTIITRWLGKVCGWLFVVGAAILGGLGVYLGRFLYFDSLDALSDLLSVLNQLLEHYRYPQSIQQTLTFSTPFALFFLFVYVTLFLLGRLVSETDKRG